jgi:MFS family permease
MMMGDYYCYDIPAALKSQLGDHMGNPTNFETSYALLYSVYAIPNIILPFCGGFLIDKWGCKFCMILFSVFLVIGQVVFTIGFESRSWPIMYVGRIIYAFGGRKY